MGVAESGNLKSWTQCEITPNQAREHVVVYCSYVIVLNCCVLNFVSTCCGVFCFSSVPCPLAVAMVFHVGNNWAHSVSVEEIRVFQACIVVNTKSGGMF